MTKQQQVKKDTPKAVELNKAALDQVAGGLWPQAIATNDTITAGTSNTVLKR